MRKNTLVTIVIIAAVFAVGLLVGGRLHASSDRAAAAGEPQRNASASAPSEPGDPVDTHLFRNIARRLNPMVVFITTESHVKAEIPPIFGDEFFRQFFGQLPTRPQEQIQRALGSGFIVGNDGEILTNNHVVAGADDIRVALFSDETTRYDAKVVGRDPLTDTALIRLQNGPTDLPTATLGNSDALQPGDWVMAIGNPFNLGHTVTLGVVSYLGRPFSVSEGHFEKMIQTDASINPGNSGGPLIDTEGRVVGINAAILGSEGSAGNIGIGFAVPINTAKDLLPQLRQGKVVRGRIGLEVTPIREDEAEALHLPKAEGALVRQVQSGSPAERAGFQPGDVILEFNGKPIHNADELVSMVTSTAPGTRVNVVISRGGTRQTIPVTIEELQSGTDANGANGGGTGFGLVLADLTPDFARRLGLPAGAQGALIQDVQQGSAAQLAGLRPNDIILEVNHQAVHGAAEAASALRQASSSQVVFLLISRGGNRMFVSMRNQ